jgi:hypothetical protein
MPWLLVAVEEVGVDVPVRQVLLAAVVGVEEAPLLLVF